MSFDQNNKVFQLCAAGMEKEAGGSIEAAISLYNEAWQLTQNDFEAFTVAHYLARNRKNPADELEWNIKALTSAEKIISDEVKSCFPSLHLNTGKSYEKMGDWQNAIQHYKMAASFIDYLSADGYGKMIQSGIMAALRRCKVNNAETNK